jgi:hypothetical protein
MNCQCLESRLLIVNHHAACTSVIAFLQGYAYSSISNPNPYQCSPEELSLSVAMPCHPSQLATQSCQCLD